MKFSGITLIVVLLAASVFCPAQDRKHIVLKRATPAAANAPFSEAVLVGDTLYIGGHLGLDPATGKPGATPEDEAKLLMEAFKRTIETAGMSMDDLVSVQVHCSDVSFYSAFNGVYRTYFHEEYPARAFLGSGPLLFGARFEILGVAVKKHQNFRPAK